MGSDESQARIFEKCSRSVTNGDAIGSSSPTSSRSQRCRTGGSSGGAGPSGPARAGGCKGTARGSRSPTTTSPATRGSGPAQDRPPARRRWPTSRPNRRVGPGHRPTTRGPVGASGANRLQESYTAPWRANLPRSVFTKRASAPLVVNSRNIALYNVAAGV
jgi:hypothetical protein